MTPFSYSRLNDYELCPRQFHEVAIKKSFAKQTTPEMAEGKATHKHLELRVGQGALLPTHLKHMEPTALALANAPGTKLCEHQMAITTEFKPTGWFGKDVYCRAIADLVIDAGTKAALFDYKTGKKSNDFLQLRLTATIYFMYAPRVEEINCAYIWTKDGTSSPVKITRGEIPNVWSGLAPRIARYQEAFDSNDFPPRQSWACKRCPVTTCQYNQAKAA